MTSATPEMPDASPGLRPSLEAILLVADEPVPLVVLAQVLERPRNEVEAELRDLAASYVAEGRGFDLREIAGGWRFYTREDCAPLVERFVSDGQEVRLTQAALETLVRAWANETASTPIRINLFDPGPIRTRMRAIVFPGEDPLTLDTSEQAAELIVPMCAPGWTETGKLYDYKTRRLLSFRSPA